MPKMPKWLGDLSEKTFKTTYKQTVITEVEYYAPQLKRVRYQGEALKTVQWKAAQEVEFRVTETEYRHYTPLCWNTEKGYTDVLFYLHGKGPGSHWASALKVADEVLLIGPGGKFTINAAQEHAIMMGDETTLSAFKSMQDLLIHPGTCVLECAAHTLGWPEKIGLAAIVLESIAAHPGKVLEQWLHNHLQQDKTNSIYFLSGNADTIKKLRRLLLAAGITGSRVRSKPYWLEGKEGL